MPKNAPIAISYGLAAALVGAALWAAITLATNFQIGFMAVGVGLLCGFAVGRFAGGVGPVFGAIGGASALFGCLLGNLWSAFGAIAHEADVGFFQILSDFDYSLTFELLSETFSPIDLLFYGLAIVEGYKLGSSGRWAQPTAPAAA